ncbi:MAG TPA: outer membrane lipoprotein-sorting protein [Kofleriaceae bacterium]|nr:outer membrane lipoprotein-sorting protein [Kofleriaceae bacterium]
MRPAALCALALATWTTGSAFAAPEPPNVDTVLAKLDDLYRSTSSIGRVEITVVSPRSTRTMRVKAWTSGEDRALIVIEAPSRDAGTATLRVGDNLWTYLPRIARTMRVPPAMMLSSWMGTDFTNDDLVKESSLRHDFAATLGARSASPAGWWITLEVKPNVVGRWARIELLVSDDWLPIEERHYDRKRRLARTMRFDEVKPLGGRVIPTRIVVQPTDAADKRTEMRYVEIAFDVAVPAETFSLSRLERR